MPKIPVADSDDESAPATVASARVDGFAVDVLAALADRGEGADATVERALRVYLEDAKLKPAGWQVPVELDSADPEAAAVEVRIDLEALEAITVEAEAQGVRLGTILGHAVMYLWKAERRPDSPPAEDDPEVSVADAIPPVRRRVSPRSSGG